jgi:hypothetical protein
LMLAGVGTAVFALVGLRPALAAAGRVAVYAPWFLGLSALGLGNLLSFAQIPCQAGVGCTQHQAMSGFGGTVDATGGVIVALIGAVAAFPMARRMRNVAGWQRLARPSLLAGAAMFACLVASGLGATTPVHGLLQRAAATIGNVWVAVLAANLIQVSRRAAPRPSPRGRGYVRPGGTESRVAWIAWARARADSAVSSTATRADGPAPGSRKSMLRVCSAGACTG